MNHQSTRAVRYDNIYWMDKIKSISFHIHIHFILCAIHYFVMSQITLFMVTRFLHLDDCDLYTSSRGVKGRQQQEKEQPGQYEELVPKPGTTSVAWTRVFKHCGFKTTDF